MFGRLIEWIFQNVVLCIGKRKSSRICEAEEYLTLREEPSPENLAVDECETESLQLNLEEQDVAISCGRPVIVDAFSPQPKEVSRLPTTPRKPLDIRESGRVYSWVEQLAEFRHYKARDKDGCFEGDDYKLLMHPSMGMVILFILDVGLVISVNSSIFKASTSTRKKNPRTGRFRALSMNDVRIKPEDELIVDRRRSYDF